MRSSRIPIGLILFPLLMMVERLMYFGLRSILLDLVTGPPELGGMGDAPASVSYARGVLIGSGYLAATVGAAAAVGFGARRVLVLGLGLAALAYALLAFATPESLLVIAALLGAGSGLFLASLYAAAAEQLAEAQPMTLAALFAGLALALNVGSFLGPFLSTLLLIKLSNARAAGLSAPWMFGPSLLFGAVLMGIAAGATATVFALDREPIAPAPAVRKPAYALLLLAAVMLPCYLISDLQVIPSKVSGSVLASLMVQLGATVGAPLVVLVVLIAFAVVGSRASRLRPLGGGLLVTALGGALYLVGSGAAGSVLSPLGSNLAEPLALTLIAGVTPRRYAPGAFALWLSFRRVVTENATLGGEEPIGWVVTAGVIGCVLGGAALLARGRAIETARFQAPASAGKPSRQRASRRRPAKAS